MDLAKNCKYALDRLFALVLLALTSPLLVLIAIAIRIDSPGAPLFLQARVGAGGRTFTIFKFRTMRCGSERQGLGVTTAPDDERITRIGKILRDLSLDELPQLINIALGEMSFIGPRPTLQYQVDAYTPRQRRRLLFRPGITGWAQVNGRNSIPWERRIELDLEYIDHYSLWLDVRILWRTLRVVLGNEGIYADEGARNDAFVRNADDTAVAPVEDASLASSRNRARRADASARAVETSARTKERVGGVEGDESNAATHPTRASRLTPLLVVGAGGHARVVIDAIERQGVHQIVGVVDDAHHELDAEILGYPVLGGREVLDQPGRPAHAFVAIGAPGDRSAWNTYVEARGVELATVIHPMAVVARDVEIGAGTVLMPGSIVNVGARIGRGCIINTGASVDHDCILADHVHVAPGARLAGGVRVGARSHIGIGACVIQEIVIGENVVVGAGAAVVRAVPSRQTAVGVPARALDASRRARSRSPQAG